MAVPFSRLNSEALDNYGSKEAFDLLAQMDGIIAVLADRGSIQFETGGQPDFRERVLYGPNTNIGYRGKNAQIPTVDDEGFTMASVPQKVIDGALVYNQVELDQVAGNPAIAPGLIKDKISQYNSTWVRTIADKLRQATPGTDDPYTLLPSATTGTVNGILVAATPSGQSGITTAGISRGETTTIGSETTRWWANQYSNTSYDLTTVAGRRGLDLDVYKKCVRGNSRMFEPDWGIAGDEALSSLQAFADNQRRGTFEDARLKALGYTNIMFNNAALIRDASSRFSNKVAFLSSRALKVKVLRGQGKVTQEMLDSRNNLKSLPIFWRNGKQAHPDIDSLNWVLVGYSVHSLVPKSLMDHGLADNVS